MPLISDATPEQGAVFVATPETSPSFWQPVPANGHATVHVTPRLLPMEHPVAIGTQTIAPGCYIREHSHPVHEEIVHLISGKGRCVIDGVDHHMVPGSTVFIGKSRRHMFVNDGPEDFTALWVIQPPGLEDFFEQVGRRRLPGEPAPEPFPRPADVLAIEQRTAFSPPPADARRP